MPDDGPTPPPGVPASHLPLPGEFQGANGAQQTENWSKWKRRFERYRQASGLIKQPNEDQVSLLLYCMGDTADDILATLKIDESKATYEEVITALGEYFDVRKNTIVERAKFNRRQQRPGEPIEKFIQDVYKLAEDCEYGSLKDELIRDRLVAGVADEGLSDHMQRKSKLTLIEAVRICRQSEARKQDRGLVRGNGVSESQSANNVDYVSKPNAAQRSGRRYQGPTQGNTYRSNVSRSARNVHVNREANNTRTSTRPTNQCQWCGKEYHPRKHCPAKNAKCKQCNKPGHYAVVCRGGSQSWQSHSQVNELQVEFDEVSLQDEYYDDMDNEFGIDDAPFLGEISDVDAPFLGENYYDPGSDPYDDDEYWSEDVYVNNRKTKFKLDSGAKVTVVSEHLSWVKNEKLVPFQEDLFGPGHIKIPVVGKFVATLQFDGRKLDEEVYVIKHQKCCLLSRKACYQLGLIARVNEVGLQESSPSANFQEEFPGLFKGLGRVNEKYKYHIAMRDNAKPLCLYTPRKVPHPLLPKLKQEIDNMVEQGVVSPVKTPTEWCSGIVCVPKHNGAVRVCVDLTALNKSVQREIHPMASVDSSLANLGSSNSKFFTKLDANSGFWQIPLDEKSRLLTTFITPFGRFCFNRLPFGISSAPEIFQRMMSNVLDGLDSVICHMDDILIHSATQEEHNRQVRAVLQRLQEAGLTLNSKCEFSKQKIRFLGHIIDHKGLQADPQKTSAIAEFPAPTNITELQRFMGMVNQLGKFIPGLAEMTEPMRQLLRKETAWYWGPHQQKSFQQVKEILISPRILAHYDPNHPTIIAADASSSGIGAVILQIQDDGKRRPISYASRSLNETEQRYAVIEKEALAATWACEKFSDYVMGLEFTLETDHKPLVPLLNSKELAKMPPRIQRFKLRMMRFNPTVMYVPGKLQVIADSLSRAPTGRPLVSDSELVAEVETYAGNAIRELPATEQRLQDIVTAQKADPECAAVRGYCSNGWPAYMPHAPLLKQWWENRAHLAVINDLLLYDNRIVVPSSMRLDILNCIHQGHLGVSKCRVRARTSVWWPGMSKAIEEMVGKCVTCAIHRPETKEPLMPSSLPERPWQRLGSDLFQFQGKTYLIVVDYYSRWVEIKKLSDQTSESVIIALKELFSQQGIPETIMSDNGPQYSASQFKEFAAAYGFTHITSSPNFPQANGEAERAVRTIKSLLRKNQDIYLALLTYRSTPLHNGYSPSELLMGRKLRTQLPTLPNNLKPAVPKPIDDKENQYRQNQEQNFNRRHRAKELPVLQPGDQVWLRDQQRYGQVIEKTQNPRSYLVKASNGSTVRRNRTAIVFTGKEQLNTGELPNTSHCTLTPTEQYNNKTVPSDYQQNPARNTTATAPITATASLPTTTTQASAAAQVPQSTPPRLHTRSRAEIKPPTRFKDYVMN